MEVIVTPRLILRLLHERDVTLPYVRSLNDPKIVRLTEARHRKWTRNKVLQYVRDGKSGKNYFLIGVFLKDDAKHIGNIRIFNVHPVHRRAELGIMIFDTSSWGKGFGLEALKAAVGFAFKDLKLHRVHADYYALNIGSAKIFKRAGFKVEGLYKDHFYLENKFVDSIRVAILNKEVK